MQKIFERVFELRGYMTEMMQLPRDLKTAYLVKNCVSEKTIQNIQKKEAWVTKNPL